MSIPGKQARKTPTSPSSNPSFRILSYNVNFGLFMDENENKSNKNVIQAILDSNAEIVCLQETNENSELLIRKYTSQQYPHQIWHHPTNYYAGGSAFLAKSHIQLKRLHCIKAKVAGAFFYNMIVRATFAGETLTPSSPETKLATAPSSRSTEVQIEEVNTLHQQRSRLLSSPSSAESSSPVATTATQERAVDIINVHLRPPLSDTGGAWDHVQAYFSTTDAIRLAEVQELVSLLPKDQIPKIILGDFNEGSMGSSFKWLYSNNSTTGTSKSTAAASSPQGVSFPHHGRQFKDALYEFHGNASTWYWPVWKLYVFGSYDHIFFESTRLKAKQCDIMKLYSASDHLPVLATLEWTM